MCPGLDEIRALSPDYQCGLCGPVNLPNPIELAELRAPIALEDEAVGLTASARETFRDLYDQLVDLDQRLEKIDGRLERLFDAHPVCQRIAAIPGIGPLTATALVAAINDPKLFRNGRHLAAWLGLVPRQHPSGERVSLGGISKRGNRYLRTLLIHGARSVVNHAGKKKDALSLWIQHLKDRSGTAVAAVALANKNARVVWALLAHDDVYRKTV